MRRPRQVQSPVFVDDALSQPAFFFHDEGVIRGGNQEDLIDLAGHQLVKDLKGQVEFIDAPDDAVVVIVVLLHRKFLSKPGRGISLNDVYTVNDPLLQATASPVRWPLTAIELLVSVHCHLRNLVRK
jgi:hypothetical protein